MKFGNVLQWPTDEEIADLANLEQVSFKATHEYRDKLNDYLLNGLDQQGESLGMIWLKCEGLYSFVPGGITLWGGLSGARKSFCTGQVAAWLIKAGVKCCIASMEMPPVVTLNRMFRQTAGCAFGKAWVDKMLEGPCQNLWIYDELDTVPPERMLAAVTHAGRDLGIKHFIIDSLTKCGIAPGESAMEKSFIDKLAQIAKAYEMHIHLVAHVRKPPQGDDSYMPGKHDIRGASELTDLVDGCIIVWHNKKRTEIKRTIDLGLPVSEKEEEYVSKTCDQVLNIVKNRHGEFEGKISFYFHKESWQFVPDETGRVLPYEFSGTILASDQFTTD